MTKIMTKTELNQRVAMELRGWDIEQTSSTYSGERHWSPPRTDPLFDDYLGHELHHVPDFYGTAEGDMSTLLFVQEHWSVNDKTLFEREIIRLAGSSRNGEPVLMATDYEVGLYTRAAMNVLRRKPKAKRTTPQPVNTDAVIQTLVEALNRIRNTPSTRLGPRYPYWIRGQATDAVRSWAAATGNPIPPYEKPERPVPAAIGAFVDEHLLNTVEECVSMLEKLGARDDVIELLSTGEHASKFKTYKDIPEHLTPGLLEEWLANHSGLTDDQKFYTIRFRGKARHRVGTLADMVWDRMPKAHKVVSRPNPLRRKRLGVRRPRRSVRLRK